MSTPLRRIDTATLLRFFRFGLTEGATRVHFQVGSPPRFTIGAREETLRYRQLAREDTEAIVGLLFEGARVPERLSEAPAEGAWELYFYYELPGEGLFEVDVSRENSGLDVAVEIIRPLADPAEIERLES